MCALLPFCNKMHIGDAKKVSYICGFYYHFVVKCTLGGAEKVSYICAFYYHFVVKCTLGMLKRYPTYVRFTTILWSNAHWGC